MLYMRLRQLLGVVLLGLALTGCKAVGTAPESAYEPLGAQTYPFAAIWECLVEAVEGEGLSLEALGAATTPISVDALMVVDEGALAQTEAGLAKIESALVDLARAGSSASPMRTSAAASSLMRQSLPHRPLPHFPG